MSLSLAAPLRRAYERHDLVSYWRAGRAARAQRHPDRLQSDIADWGRGFRVAQVLTMWRWMTKGSRA
jgi:hypothetical protein